MTVIFSRLLLLIFYNNTIKHLLKENEQYSNWIHPHYQGYGYYYNSNVDYYHCDIIETDFNNWIEKGI